MHGRERQAESAGHALVDDGARLPACVEQEFTEKGDAVSAQTMEKYKAYVERCRLEGQQPVEYVPFVRGDMQQSISDEPLTKDETIAMLRKRVYALEQQVSSLQKRVKSPEDEKRLLEYSWAQNPDRMGS